MNARVKRISLNENDFNENESEVVEGDDVEVASIDDEVDPDEEFQEEDEFTRENMNKKGLRTMILGYKCIAKDDILEIKSKIQRIKKSLLNPESRIEAMFKDIEKNLKYLGITGLSEEMLPCTAKTISKLQEAGIKI